VGRMAPPAKSPGSAMPAAHDSLQPVLTLASGAGPAAVAAAAGAEASVRHMALPARITAP
jgi:hypothetical protein